MTEFASAAKALSVLPSDLPKEKDWKQFHVPDTYNPSNVLTGFMCRGPSAYYGALLITHVNNKTSPQLIYCVPKLHYPFDRAGRYNFPKAKRIEVYTKLDGTSVLCYKYHDHRHRPFLTFKTRLTPVLRDSKYVPFARLLKDTGRIPEVLELRRTNPWNLSLELWGARNFHLIQYKTPIELSLLFAIDRRGQIYPPSRIETEHNLPTAHRHSDVTGNYVETYKWHQQEMEDGLQELDQGYSGDEGRVWYCLLENLKWVMFKCKSSVIEKIHWSLSAGLDNNVIRATALNVLETDDKVTFAAVKTLLLEEFNEHEILFSGERIKKVITEIEKQIEDRERILIRYDMLGMSIDKDKAGVMRAMSELFDRKKMQEVYSTVMTFRDKQK